MPKRKSGENRSDPRTGDWQPDADLTDISGDPGVGGLLADPEEPAEADKTEHVATGAPTPDPKLPKAHGDWAPNRPWHGTRSK